MRPISRRVAVLIWLAAGLASSPTAGAADSVLCKSLTTPPGAVYLFPDLLRDESEFVPTHVILQPRSAPRASATM